MTTTSAPAGAASRRAEAAAPDCTLADDWSALAAAEAAAITVRRQLVLGEAAGNNQIELQLPRVGLALSGGGVRSATFALGLMRGLAQSQNHDKAPGDPARRTLGSEGLLGRLD